MDEEHFSDGTSHENYAEYIELDADGLANNVEQLRAIAHDLVGVLDYLLGIPSVQYSLPQDIYDHIEMVGVSAHTVVCKHAARALSDVLERLISTGEITPTEVEEDDRETGPNLPALTPQDVLTADRILRQVFEKE